MKEKLTRNIGLKVLSLLLAVLLWIIIMNVDDPVIQQNFSDIPVTLTNENVLKSKDQVYEIISGDTVTVKVKGKRSDIESIKKSDFQVIADLSQLSIVNAVHIDVSVPKLGDKVEIINQDDFTLKVSLEKRKTEQFRIDVVEKGKVADGYYIEEKKASPNMIQVSGAESVINKINQVIVDVDVSNADESFKVNAVPKVYDKNGTLMDSSKMTFNYDEVKVSVNLLKTKTVNLYIDLKGNPAVGYEYVNFEYEPKQVIIAGKQSELDKVQYIKGEYNINNLKEDVEGEVDIQDFIKNNVVLIDDNKTAVIKIDIEKVKSKEISFNSSDIEFRSVPDGTKVDINKNIIINVMVYGKQDSLDAANSSTIQPYIDFSDTQLGTSFATIQFETSDSNLTVSNSSISVTLSKLNE